MRRVCKIDHLHWLWRLVYSHRLYVNCMWCKWSTLCMSWIRYPISFIICKTCGNSNNSPLLPDIVYWWLTIENNLHIFPAKNFLIRFCCVQNLYWNPHFFGFQDLQKLRTSVIIEDSEPIHLTYFNVNQLIITGISEILL